MKSKVSKIACGTQVARLCKVSNKALSNYQAVVKVVVKEEEDTWFRKSLETTACTGSNLDRVRLKQSQTVKEQ